MGKTPRGPLPTVDVIIEIAKRGIVLIERRFPPHGWALPGGFIEVGETTEAAAIREAHEETGLAVTLTELFHVYSDPARDVRHHTISVVYLARAAGEPKAADDAANARLVDESTLPAPLAFDHGRILAEYFRYRRTGQRPTLG